MHVVMSIGQGLLAVQIVRPPASCRVQRCPPIAGPTWLVQPQESSRGGGAGGGGGGLGGEGGGLGVGEASGGKGGGDGAKAVAIGATARSRSARIIAPSGPRHTIERRLSRLPLPSLTCPKKPRS